MERQLEARCENSRTISASMYGRADSSIVDIGAHVSDVRISQADDLAGVAGIGEDFLIAGEAGIKNDFAAAAGAGARGAAVKYSPVFECENGRA